MSSHEMVLTLVKALHTNIDSIHATIESISSHPTHEAELQRLATEREARIFDLRTAHAQALAVLANQRRKEQHELDAQRQREAEEIEEQRKKEWEEVLRRREVEDQEREERIKAEEAEREKAKQKEDECREAEREERELTLAGDIEKELERVEDEIDARVEEGKKALKELDEKRRAINIEIDNALNKPTVIPQIRYRSRTRTLSRAGVMEPVILPHNVMEKSALRNENKEVQQSDSPVSLPTPDDSNVSRSLPIDAIPSSVRKVDEPKDLADISRPKSPTSSKELVSTINSQAISPPIEKFPDLNDAHFKIEPTSPEVSSPPIEVSSPDPMMRRLWTTTYEDLSPDPMMRKLWAVSTIGESVSNSKAVPQQPQQPQQAATHKPLIQDVSPDPMMRRLWTTKFEDLSPDPMMLRLWANLPYTQEKSQIAEILDVNPIIPTVSTPTVNESQSVDASNVYPMMRELLAASIPAVSKSQSANELSADPMMRRLWTTRFEDLSPDPMMLKLWANLPYTQEKLQIAEILDVNPIIPTASTPTVNKSQSANDLGSQEMMRSLSVKLSSTDDNFRPSNNLDDPMIRKLWANSTPVKYESRSTSIPDPMMQKLWAEPSFTKNESNSALDPDPMMRKLWAHSPLTTHKVQSASDEDKHLDQQADTEKPASKDLSADPMMRNLLVNSVETPRESFSAPIELRSDSASIAEHVAVPKETPESGSALQPAQITPVTMSENLISHELESQKTMLLANNLPEDQGAAKAFLETTSDEAMNDQKLASAEPLHSATGMNAVQDSTSAIVPNPRASLHFEFDHYGQRHFVLPISRPSSIVMPRTPTNASYPDESLSVSEGLQNEHTASRPQGEPWPLRDSEDQTPTSSVAVHERDLHNAHATPSDSTEYWSQSDEDNDSDHVSVDGAEIHKQFGSLRPQSISRASSESEFPLRSAIDLNADDIESQENASSEEKYGVPRPTSPIRSLSRLGSHPESTLSDSDSADTDSEDDNHSDYGPQNPYPGDVTDQYLLPVEPPLEIVPEHEPLTEFNDTYTSHRNSGIFSNLVDVVRSDIPAVRHQLDNYQPAAEYVLGNSTRPRAVSFEDDPEFAPVEPSQYESSMHVRTHTADTVPSFETYAQSDSIPTTPSDTSSSPFMDTFDHQPIIKDAGRDRGMTVSSQPAHDLHIHTSKDVTLDPAFADAYTSFVSSTPTFPPAGEEYRDLEDRPNSGYGSFGSQTGLEAHRAEISPIGNDALSSIPDAVNTSGGAIKAGNTQFPILSQGEDLAYDSNKTPTTASPIQASKIRPKTPPRLSINPQSSSTTPIPLSGSPSPSTSFTPRPPQIPTGSPVSAFVKTRSVFESASPQGSPALTPSPITALSAIRATQHKSPPPPPPPRRSVGSRPSSLYMSEPANHDSLHQPKKEDATKLEEELDEEIFMPRSLDGNNRPPSPVFVHERSGSDTSSTREVNEPTVEKRKSTPLLGALSRLVGGHQYEGLGGHEHNPAREPLLSREDDN
ncbi:hypothetical protein VTL71DRAFT_2090 [Oculimacula yallundae]|uniref:Uncharacterized protein n=1 Tax=Oculimacula yallundae TaxID=86028 RepID=A0ABR4C9U8_9HELO